MLLVNISFRAARMRVALLIHKDIAMRLSRRTVSPEFRNMIAETFPGLADNLAYWRFIEYLLFGTWRDEASNCLIASQELLAAIEDRQAQLEARNYNGGAFLDAFDH